MQEELSQLQALNGTKLGLSDQIQVLIVKNALCLQCNQT